MTLAEFINRVGFKVNEQDVNKVNKGDGSKLGEIKGFLSSAVQTLVKAAKPTGALQTLHGETSNRTINQTVTINNKFEGDKAIQRDASKAMDKSAKDVTSELARGLAYAK